jgi:hypothetical protein
MYLSDLRALNLSSLHLSSPSTPLFVSLSQQCNFFVTSLSSIDRVLVCSSYVAIHALSCYSSSGAYLTLGALSCGPLNQGRIDSASGDAADCWFSGSGGGATRGPRRSPCTGAAGGASRSSNRSPHTRCARVGSGCTRAVRRSPHRPACSARSPRLRTARGARRTPAVRPSPWWVGSGETRRRRRRARSSQLCTRSYLGCAGRAVRLRIVVLRAAVRLRVGVLRAGVRPRTPRREREHPPSVRDGRRGGRSLEYPQRARAANARAGGLGAEAKGVERVPIAAALALNAQVFRRRRRRCRRKRRWRLRRRL